MPKFTRRDFQTTHRNQVAGATENLVAAGYLAPALLLVNTRKADLTMVLGLAADAPDSAMEEARRDGHGVIPVRGAFSDNLDVLAALVKERRINAATLIQESWVAIGAVADRVVASGGAVSDQPDRGEAVVVVSTWPAEFYVESTFVPFTREPTAIGERIVPGTPIGGDNDAALMRGASIDWLTNLLPVH